MCTTSMLNPSISFTTRPNLIPPCSRSHIHPSLMAWSQAARIAWTVAPLAGNCSFKDLARAASTGFPATARVTSDITVVNSSLVILEGLLEPAGLLDYLEIVRSPNILAHAPRSKQDIAHLYGQR